MINSSDYSNLSKTDINLFIIEEILPRSLYHLFDNKMQINIYNDINHYTWSKILSTIMIESGYSAIDQNYQLIHNIRLLNDFAKIFIKYQYHIEEISKKEAADFLLEYTFLDLNSSNRILSEIMYDYSKNDLEYYVSYLHLKDLFNKNCKNNTRIPNYLFIEKIFKHGFLPVYNYKSILN